MRIIGGKPTLLGGRPGPTLLEDLLPNSDEDDEDDKGGGEGTEGDEELNHAEAALVETPQFKVSAEAAAAQGSAASVTRWRTASPDEGTEEARSGLQLADVVKKAWEIEEDALEEMHSKVLGNIKDHGIKWGDVGNLLACLEGDEPVCFKISIMHKFVKLVSAL